MTKKRVTYRKIGKKNPHAELNCNQYQVRIDGIVHTFKRSKDAKFLYSMSRKLNEQKEETQ